MTLVSVLSSNSWPANICISPSVKPRQKLKGIACVSNHISLKGKKSSVEKCFGITSSHGGKKRHQVHVSDMINRFLFFLLLCMRKCVCKMNIISNDAAKMPFVIWNYRV